MWCVHTKDEKYLLNKYFHQLYDIIWGVVFGFNVHDNKKVSCNVTKSDFFFLLNLNFDI